MKKNKLTITRKLLYLFMSFVVLFILRLSYGYIAYPDSGRTVSSHSGRSSFTLDRKNYASKKMAYKGAVRSQQATSSVDQKYEKVGTLSNITESYKSDEEKLYQLIRDEQLMIQLEQKSGLRSAQKLNIALGVVPAKFDATIIKLRNIGTLKYIQIDKKDKTNEYNKLEAKRISLQKARQTLLDLKNNQGDVGDMIGLVNRLLEIENQIQSLGVSLGEFDSKNEFCTVKFTLHEVGKAKPISLSHRFRVASVWATGIYLTFWVIIIVGSLGIYLFTLMVAALKLHFPNLKIWKMLPSESD